jgi:hypothetical protein
VNERTQFKKPEPNKRLKRTDWEKIIQGTDAKNPIKAALKDAVERGALALPPLERTDLNNSIKISRLKEPR